MKALGSEIKLPLGWRKIRDWYYRRMDGADAYEWEPGKWLAEGPSQGFAGKAETRKVDSLQKAIEWVEKNFTFDAEAFGL